MRFQTGRQQILLNILFKQNEDGKWIYLSYIDDWSELGIKNRNKFKSDDGTLNTYKAYLSMLTAHHSMPVVISEFGVSTGRGMAQRDYNTGRNQGNMSEKEQGEALVECYNDIMDTGCAGGCSVGGEQGADHAHL